MEDGSWGLDIRDHAIILALRVAKVKLPVRQHAGLFQTEADHRLRTTL